MKILLLFSLICLVSAKHGTTSTTEKINLNFDSAIILEKRDIQGIKTFFENIVKLLEELNNATLPKTTTETIQRRRPREPKRDQYRRSGIINWMKNITKIFPNVTETKIKEAFNTVNDEVNRAVNYNGTTHILTEKKIIDYINHWRRHSKDIAKIINTTLNENNPLFNKIARRVNDYYSDADVKRLYNILREFKRYLENDMDTSNLVKQLMNSAIFKKYDSLSEAAKADLKKDFRTFAEYVSLDNILKFLDKNHDLTYSALRRSIDQKLKVARHVKKHKDDEGKSSELIVNNIELVLKPKGSKNTY